MCVNVIQTPDMKQQTQTPGTEYQTTGIVDRVPDTEHQTPSTWHQTPSVGNYESTDKNMVQPKLDSVVVSPKFRHVGSPAEYFFEDRKSYT